MALTKLKYLARFFFLTPSCQSGVRLTNTLLVISAAVMPGQCVAQVSWAHQVGTLQSNGAITLRSPTGGSFVGVENPTGAVVKANQNSVTQPPTVIIQATAAGYGETIPMIVASSVSPTCPTSYTQVFSRTGAGAIAANASVWNVNGSRWSLTNFSSGGNALVGWLSDNNPEVYSNVVVPYGNSGVVSNSATWTAVLCAK